ncbi:hypothetical protein KGQ27_00750 [Patescibacteria group bacterium]|nr:hypothetical protein [Patescibacteria group bacterium]MDE1946876.1 hypothetical protein [Patescibacteria group bacterium]MDE2010696.1 hypothetical protein [Patescibacteria group bacterium]MDE2232698.1 hypothetical protein [Patescibacteria group bacterium]
MEKYALILTGVGTSSTSRSFYGPLKGTEEADAFVEKVRTEIGKLGKSSIIAVSIVDNVPRGWGAVPAEDFQGFIKT